MHPTNEKYSISPEKICFDEANEAHRSVAVYFLSIMIAFFFIAGIAILFLNGSPKPGTIIGFVFSMGVSYYLLKLLLWNLYGKDIIRIQNNSLQRVLDYKYFRSEKKLLQVSIFVEIDGIYAEIEQLNEDEIKLTEKYPVKIEYEIDYKMFLSKNLLLQGEEVLKLMEFARKKQSLKEIDSAHEA